MNSVNMDAKTQEFPSHPSLLIRLLADYFVAKYAMTTMNQTAC